MSSTELVGCIEEAFVASDGSADMIIMPPVYYKELLHDDNLLPSSQINGNHGGQIFNLDIYVWCSVPVPILIDSTDDNWPKV